MPIKVQHLRKRGSRRRNYQEARKAKLGWADHPMTTTDPFLRLSLDDRRRFEADVHHADILDADQVEDGPPASMDIDELAEHLDYMADSSPSLFKSY